ncbi:anaerobic sulfite reductase subunit AsrB [Niameybacter massiliensis]|uniref:anaerobic sulfite reductase subunit AsrB n=1 Tax=Niameybacter massiliensis TaxID=1658108 RepID=UPI0006B63764|nr:anaerobic sulfite reductase subunit AsrB [Niameybacter massiliensis]
MKNNLLPKAYKLVEIIPQTPVEYLFRVTFDHIDEIQYGQFVQVSLPKVGEAPISISRFDKNEGIIELLIRRVGTVTDALFELKPGDNIYLRGPYGHGFPFEVYKDKRIIIIGGGSGVAPVRSMVDTIANDMKLVKDINVLFGFKNESLILFQEDIKRWSECLSLQITLDEPDNVGHYLGGRVTEHLDKLPLLKDKDKYQDLHIVIVGPPIMMKMTALACSNYGINDHHIWLSFERNMSCAVGKCGHCKINETYVCLDGPIFRYDQAKKLID